MFKLFNQNKNTQEGIFWHHSNTRTHQTRTVHQVTDQRLLALISLDKCGKIIPDYFSLHLVSLLIFKLCFCLWRVWQHAHMFVCSCLCDSEKFSHPGLVLICVTYVFMSVCSGFDEHICMFMFLDACFCEHMCVCVCVWGSPCRIKKLVALPSDFVYRDCRTAYNSKICQPAHAHTVISTVLSCLSLEDADRFLSD